QALQRSVRNSPDAIRMAVQAFLRIAVPETKLVGDHNLTANRSDGFPDEFLIGEGAVGFSRVKEGNTAVEGCTNQLDGGSIVGRGTVTEAQAHTAQTNRGYLEIAFTKCSLLHISPSNESAGEWI